MTRNVRRNLQLRLKLARNAKQKPQQPSKVEINTKQFVQRLSKWQETQNNAHFFLQGRYCLAFISTFNLSWRFRRTFLVILGLNEGLVLRFFLHSNANGDIDASFFHQSEQTRARNGVSYSICNSDFSINVRQWYNNR